MNRRELIGYAVLSLPLAMSMMPIYMISPKFYGETLGVELGALGAVLFLTRMLDTVQDPWIGRLVDRLEPRPRGWTQLMCLAATLLAGGFVMLFTPPAWSHSGLLLWLGFSLVLVYAAHSLLSVCYLTWGARLTDDVSGRARVTAWREGVGLFGVVVASVLPAVWVERFGARQGYQFFAWAFVLILLLCLAAMLLKAPKPRLTLASAVEHWRQALAPRRVRRVLWFYLMNAIAVAIPATLVLFFIDDVLQLPGYAGLFLGLYFCAGVIALPLWVMLADRLGKGRAWLAGIVLAALSLLGSYWMGPGDLWAFCVICVLAGAGLGADIALPPAMLADAIPAAHRRSTGLYFGVWVLIGKFALALAAGLVLPALQFFNYRPGQVSSIQALSAVYVFLPLLFKTMAVAVLAPRSSIKSFFFGLSPEESTQ